MKNRDMLHFPLVYFLCAAAAACALVPAQGFAATYRFDETQWKGDAGEVVDDATSLNGRAFGGATTLNATPAVPGDPGSCRYGTFDGNDDYVEVADNAALDLSTEVTVAAWIRLRSAPPSDLYTIASKDTNYEYHVNTSRQVYWWWNDSSNNTRSLTTAVAINLNEWHHVAITYKSGAQAIYIDGALAASATYTGTLANNDLPFYVGTDWNFISRAFDGDIDEVRVLATALTQAQVQALVAETHPCVQFTINHDGFGIHCLAETVTVNVVEALSGAPKLDYSAQVRLDTGTGAGTWALVAGTGSFSDGAADDGVATYTWPLGQSQAVFSLYYPTGPPSVDVDVVQVGNAGVHDSEAEGRLVFSPNGFTVTATALPDPPGAATSFAANQVAGTDFALHLAAFGQTPGDPVCGIIESYTGLIPKRLKFWTTYSNPATGATAVTIDGLGAAASEGAAAPQDVVFANGQAVVTAKYKDVGQIRVSMKDDTLVDAAQLPTGIRGATASFVVRPYDFLLTNIMNGSGTTANPQANDAAGGVFVAAGAPFRATVTARDAEGSTTPSYGREAIPETARLVPQLHAPAGGAVPAVGSTVGFGAFASGVATGTDFTWPEVGIVRLVPRVGDGNYLGAGDVVVATPSERVGRFVPSHFVAALNTPLFATACGAGGFTYAGQPFGYTTPPQVTVTASAVGGTTTTNYTGAFFKLATSTLQNRVYTSPGGALDASGLPTAAIDPVVAPAAPGVATLTFSSGTGLAFAKGAPQAPFPAGVRLSIDVLDADGVAAAGAAPLGNPVTFGASSGIDFSTGQQIRYGRVRVGTAIGSELIDLPVRVVAEQYSGAGAGFVSNLADVCTTGVSLALSGYTANLAAGETCARDAGAPGASGIGCAAAAPPPLRFAAPPAAGDFNLRLAAPGAGNNGSVLVNATVPAWLRFDWNGAAPGDESPVGQATFGIYNGESRQIYTREIYQ